MSRSWRWAALLTYLLASPALAIDCARATRDYERAICSDPRLVAADDDLSRFYFDRLKHLAGEAHDLLQADQRHWVEARGGACHPSTTDCLFKDMAARRRAITVCSAPTGTRASGSDDGIECLYYHHGGCPALDARGSARFERYPFLIERLVARMRDQSEIFDCVPDPDQSPPRTNVAESSDAIAAERPGFVFVSSRNAYCSRGAAHCYSEDTLTAFDTSTRKVVAFSDLFNGTDAASPIYVGLLRAIEGRLDVPCCGDDTKKTGATLGDLRLDPVLPSGWSPTPEGNLVVGFQYNALGHTFLSRATVPRAEFITAIAPKYTGLFDPLPR